MHDGTHAGNARDVLRQRGHRVGGFFAPRTARRVSPLGRGGDVHHRPHFRGFAVAARIRTRDLGDANGEASEHAGARASVERGERASGGGSAAEEPRDAAQHLIRRRMLEETSDAVALTHHLHQAVVVVRGTQTDPRGRVGVRTGDESELHLVPVPEQRRGGEGVAHERLRGGRGNLRDSGDDVEHLVALESELGGVGEVLPRAPAASVEVRAGGVDPVGGGANEGELDRLGESPAALHGGDPREETLAGNRALAEDDEAGVGKLAHAAAAEGEAGALHLHHVAGGRRRGKRRARGGGGGGGGAHPGVPNRGGGARRTGRTPSKLATRRGGTRRASRGRAHRRAHHPARRRAHAPVRVSPRT